jgi:hypothetical protein
MNDAETKPVEPPTLAGTRARYPQIAKMPERSDVDTGETLGKYLIVTGLRRAFLAEWSPEDEQAARIAMAAALLWRRLAATDPGRAELTAGQIAEAWADGEGPTEWLHTLAVRSGVDPDEVLSVASVEYALMVAGQSDAELAARQLADGAHELAKALKGNRYALEAARIEYLQTGAEAAMRWVLGCVPDQWDGEPGTEWDGRESARDWHQRVTAKPEPDRM